MFLSSHMRIAPSLRPAGRPNMSPYICSDKLLKDKKLPVFLVTAHSPETTLTWMIL